MIKSKFLNLILLFSIILLGVSLITGYALAKAGEELPRIEIKFSHTQQADPYSHNHGPALIFKNIVESASNGKIKVTIYPGGSLGDNKASAELSISQGNVLTMAGGGFAVFSPTLQVLDIPYIFKNREIAWNVIDGWFGQELIEKVAKEANLRIVIFGENGGFRDFTNNTRPIHTPEDMVGLKIRTMEVPADIKTVQSLGASPAPIEWLELYTSLQTGVIDGQENSVPTMVLGKFYEVQKYLTLDGHKYSPMIGWVGNDWFESLPEKYKKIILEAGKMATQYQRFLCMINEQRDIEFVKKQGMEVYDPTIQEKNMFAKAAQKPVIEWLKGKIDKEWIDKILRAIKEAETECLL